MFKISLIILSLAILHKTNGFGFDKSWKNLINLKYWRENLPNLDLTHNQCVVFRSGGKTSSRIACVSKTGDDYFECPANFIFDGLNEQIFDSFAIGLPEDTSLIGARVPYLQLYPRATFSRNYMGPEVIRSGSMVRLALFASNNADLVGVQVGRDCFDELVSFFSRLVKSKIEVSGFEEEKGVATKFANLYIV